LETVEGVSSEVLEVEEALDVIAERIRYVEDEEEAALMRQRRLPVAERKELRALPVEPTVRVVEVGETFSERWTRADLETRRALLSSVVQKIRVLKGRRGGLPANRQPTRDRVDIVWRGM